jgi:hypothetical protein
MKPKPIPTLTGKNAENFMRQDREPLTTEQKENLAKCRELYLRSKTVPNKEVTKT